MSELRIQGGHVLRGEVEIPGSKNSALAILSSIFCSAGIVVLHNVPQVTDVWNKLQLLRQFGAKIEWHEGTLFLDCSQVQHHEPDEELVRPIRTSFYLLGPLLARVGRARLPMPGGCKIGARPVDFHLKGLAALGARIELANGCYIAEAPSMHGAEIYFDFPSAGATQHLMATATLVPGVTVIRNAAVEPEVVALAQFLKRLGARIEGEGSNLITVHGKQALEGGEFHVPSDRLQAGTYLLGGAITGGDVTVRGVLPEHQAAVVQKVKEAGAQVEEGPDWVRVATHRRLRGIRVKTMPYPGFPTDMQQPMSALLAFAEGTSAVEETIYESRIGHVQELNRMGAQMRIEGRTTVIQGVPSLRGAVVEATDLRAGAALVLAGLAAEGETIVRHMHFIDRGYEGLEDRLRSLGADVERVETEDSRKPDANRKPIES